MKRSMQQYYVKHGYFQETVLGLLKLKPTDDAQQFNLTAINKKRRKDIDLDNDYMMLLQKSRYL